MFFSGDAYVGADVDVGFRDDSDGGDLDVLVASSPLHTEHECEDNGSAYIAVRGQHTKCHEHIHHWRDSIPATRPKP